MAQTMTANNNAEATIWRHNGICEQCGEVVGEDDLVACHGEGGLKDYACPECFTAHYIVE